MELKEGMYVRTKNKGIFKIDDSLFWCEGFNEWWFKAPKDYGNECTSERRIIGEPSFCISDVIQEGDLVTINSKHCKDEVYRVISVSDNVIQVDCFGDGCMVLNGNDIKEVLTKEQFAANAYEVK